MKSDTPGFYAEAKLQYNATDIGTVQTNNTTTYITKSEDIPITLLSGDTLNLWGYNMSGEGIYVRNFGLYYDDGPNVLVAVDTVNGDQGIYY